MAESISTVEYRDIQGFPGYRVGSDGTVWSLRQRGGAGSVRITTTWRQLRPVLYNLHQTEFGRPVVTLFRQGLPKVRKQVATLVLEAFVGPKPPGMECCHFPDRDTRNNRVGNLRWDTNAGNVRDKIIHGTTGKKRP